MLCLEHQAIPPIAGFSTLNEHITLTGTPLSAPTALRPWPSPARGPRRAGVSAFGFSGTNAHIVLEEAPPRPSAPEAAAPALFLLSGRTAARCAAAAGRLADALLARPSLRLVDVAHTLRVGRTAFEHRVLLQSADRGRLIEALRACAAGEAHPDLARGARDPQSITLFNEEADGRALLAGWLRAGRAADAAQLWLKGVEVDWRALPPTADRRVSLPGYPFEPRRCWVSAPEAPKAEAPKTAPRRVEPSAPAPVARLDAGLGYLERARAAAEAARRGPVVGLRNMVWGLPHRAEAGAPAARVRLTAGPDGLLYALQHGHGAAGPTHVGEVLQDRSQGYWPPPLGPAELRAFTAGADLTGACRDHRRPAEADPSPGADPAAITALHAEGQTLRARLRLPRAVGGLLDPHHLGLLWHLLSFDAQRRSGGAQPVFPYALRSLVFDGPLPEEALVVVQTDGPAVDGEPNDTEPGSRSVLVYDTAGRPRLALSGLWTARPDELPLLHLGGEG
jgi:hypothetical protein